MGLELDFDLVQGIDDDQVERSNRTPPGWMRAVLKDVTEDEKSEDTMILDFEVVRGISEPDGVVGHEGSPVKERVWGSNSDDPEKIATARKRRAMFMKRLGLLARDESGKLVPVPGKNSWIDALGAEVILHLSSRPEKDKTTGKETGRVFANVDFDGIFELNSKKVPDHIRKILTANDVPWDSAKAGGNGNGNAATGYNGHGTTTATAPAKTPIGTGAGAAGKTDFDINDL